MGIGKDIKRQEKSATGYNKGGSENKMAIKADFDDDY